MLLCIYMHRESGSDSEVDPVCAKVPVHKSASSRSFFPLATNSHAQSISPATCRSKRVDDHSRFYANLRDFRGARCDRIGNLTLALLGLECSHDVVPRDVALTCVPCDGGVAQRRPRQK